MARAIFSMDLNRTFQPTFHSTAYSDAESSKESASKALLTPLITLLTQVQNLQQQKLSSEEKACCIKQIRELQIEIDPLIDQLIATAALPAESADSTWALQQQLRGIRVLVVDNNNDQGQALLQLLQDFGLTGACVNTHQALATLRLVEPESPAYQIIILSAQDFDHHVAYLARTIKATSSFSPMMLSLAVTSELKDFERERAYFDGFACVLNPLQPSSLLQNLAHSWRGWATKINFSRQASSLVQKRILLVEDDPIPRKVTGRQFATLGYKVDVAPDGHTALKLLEQNIYDLVFMDIGLPDISGLDVTAEFRKREENNRHTPIIGLTAHGLPSDQESGLQAGMDEYLIKPLLPEQLKITLETWAPLQQRL